MRMQRFLLGGVAGFLAVTASGVVAGEAPAFQPVTCPDEESSRRGEFLMVLEGRGTEAFSEVSTDEHHVWRNSFGVVLRVPGFDEGPWTATSWEDVLHLQEVP